MKGTDLPLGARAVGMAIASYFDHAGSWVISRKALCEELDISVPTLKRCLRQLKDADIIEVVSGGKDGRACSHYSTGSRISKMAPAPRRQPAAGGSKTIPRGGHQRPPLVSGSGSGSSGDKLPTYPPSVRCSKKRPAVVNASQKQTGMYAALRNGCVPRNSPPGPGDAWPAWHDDDTAASWSSSRISAEITILEAWDGRTPRRPRSEQVRADDMQHMKRMAADHTRHKAEDRDATGRVGGLKPPSAWTKQKLPVAGNYDDDRVWRTARAIDKAMALDPNATKFAWK